MKLKKIDFTIITLLLIFSLAFIIGRLSIKDVITSSIDNPLLCYSTLSTPSYFTSNGIVEGGVDKNSYNQSFNFLKIYSKDVLYQVHFAPSGSMDPLISDKSVGLVKIVDNPQTEINIGDIIIYQEPIEFTYFKVIGRVEIVGGTHIIHRVTNITFEGGKKVGIVTKGDNNGIYDLGVFYQSPINISDVKYKLVAVLY